MLKNSSFRLFQSVAVVFVGLLFFGTARAVVIETMPVGNPDNAGELSGGGTGGDGQDRICGAVSYEYCIGTCEVSNSEYAAFLNAVATVGDPHDLYSTGMGGGYLDTGGISRSGSGTVGDPWVYTTRENRANRPVNYVGFWDACRFANWLHNGQPTGPQNNSTTEDGAYFLNNVTNPDNDTINRETDWIWAVTSEDEWYKAAYHKNDGVTGNYWDYPTETDAAPAAQPPPGTDMMNGSANYNGGGGHVDPTYRTTVCGAYDAKPSVSAYGTFDQGGNVWEWNEAIPGLTTIKRGWRGGSFENGTPSMRATWRSAMGNPDNGTYNIGFRVVNVPEPASLTLAALGLLGMLLWKGGRRGR